MQIEQSVEDPQYLTNIARRMNDNLPQDEVFNMKLLRDIYKDIIQPDDVKKYLQEKREDLEEIIQKLDESVKGLLET